MAKQCGSYIITGTIDNICFYEMNGKGYARISNPLSSKRVKTAPEFEGTRRHAALLQQASPIACAVYKTLPKEKRNATHRRRLTGTAIQMLKKGNTIAVIETQLEADALLMLAEMLINEVPQEESAGKERLKSAAGGLQSSEGRAFRRVQKVGRPHVNLRGTALYRHYVASGVASFRLPQYPELLFRRVRRRRVRQQQVAARQRRDTVPETGVIFNDVWC